MRLPYQTLVLESAMTPTKVLDRLKAAVAPVQWRRRGPSERPFEGTVDGTGFRIHRIIAYRNSFRPQLHGRIEPTPSGGARMVISLQLHPVVLVLLALGVSFFTTFWPFGPPSPSASGPDPRLMLAGISAFVVFLVLVGFIPEAHKAEQLLKDIVEAREAAGRTAAA